MNEFCLFTESEIELIDTVDIYEKEMKETLRDAIVTSITSGTMKKDLGWVTESANGKNILSKVSKVCQSIKRFVGGLKNIILKILSPAIEIAKKSGNEAIKKTEVKDEYSKVQKMIFNSLNSMLKKMKEYASKLKTSHGYEKFKIAVILASIPVPIPGATEGPIILFKLIDIAIGYVNKLKLRDVEAAVDELDTAVSSIEKVDPEMASAGAKLLERLKKILSITKNQIIKLAYKLKSFPKLSGKSMSESTEIEDGSDAESKEFKGGYTHEEYVSFMESMV